MQCCGPHCHSAIVHWQGYPVGMSSLETRISVPRAFNPSNGSRNRSRFEVSSRTVQGDKSFWLPSSLKSITSLSNPFVKHCVKLRQSSSYRRSNGSTLVVGTVPIREIYEFHMLNHKKPLKMDCLFLLDGAEVPPWLDNVSLHIIYVSSSVMRKLSGLQSTESIETVALTRIPSSFHDLSDYQGDADCDKWFPFCTRILALDGIQDPGNLGTLLRSAMAFGWSGVFLLDGCCDPFNEKALRASRGATFHLPMVSGNWTHLYSLQKKFGLKMLAGHPPNTDKLNPPAKLSQDLVDSLADKPLCLVLGSEGEGLSQVSKEACELLSIPMATHFESLNVAVAGGIFLFMMGQAA